MDYNILLNFLLAIGLGALIGIEREMPTGRKKPIEATRFAGIGGIRSYALLSLLGALMAWLDIEAGGGHTWKMVGFVISSLFLGLSYAYSSFRHDKMGITSEYAGFMTYIFGMIVMFGYHTLAIILAITLAIILSTKEYLANMRSSFSREEMTHGLKFAVISLVMLPLLPDNKYSIADMLSGITGKALEFSHPIMNMDFFNPHGIWFFVVIMAGVEYIGYILSKVMGNKGGAVLSGAVGGMISSTAVTAAMTSKSHSKNGGTYAYVAATLIASMIMCIRVIIVAGFINPAMLGTILIPAIAMLFGLGGAAWYYYRKNQKTDHSEEIEETDEYESPFEISSAMKFAGVVVFVKFIAGIGLVYQHIIDPKIFYYVLGTISGLADVDAITLDMSSKALDGSLEVIIAATTILIATISNNVVKASIAGRMGEKTFGKSVMIGFGISIALGLIAIVSMNLISLYA